MSNSSRRHVRLEVWTTRLYQVDDPDLLDITRATADAHTDEKKIPSWGKLSADARADCHRRGLDRARQLRGLTLVQAQRLALDDGLPSLGAPWAPAWDLLGPTKAGMELADAHGNGAMRLPPEHRGDLLETAIALEAKIWREYLTGWTRGASTVLGFRDQMRRSYKLHRISWEWALGRSRLVVGCLCSRPKWWPEGVEWDHCHRFETAKILVTCGARYMGELPAPPSAQLGLGLG